MAHSQQIKGKSIETVLKKEQIMDILEKYFKWFLKAQRTKGRHGESQENDVLENRNINKKRQKTQKRNQ